MQAASASSSSSSSSDNAAVWNVSEKTIIITGANTGIGKATATALACKGATLYLACRSKERTDPVIEEIKKVSNNQAIHFLPLDLNDFDHIRASAQQFLALNVPLHCLINNAGVVGITDKTKNGLESHMGVNHFGHFLFTLLLLPKLIESAPSRIIIVGSDAYKFTPGKKLDMDDLNGDKVSSMMGYMAFYGRSKLANWYFASELQRRLRSQNINNVTVNTYHPGTVATEIGRNAPWYLKFVPTVVNWFARTPEVGAESAVYLATDAAVDKSFGLYYYDSKEYTHSLPDWVNDQDQQTQLWQQSERITGIQWPPQGQ